MAFSDLKKNSQKLADKIADQFKNETQGGYADDPREWYPAGDAVGNGSCLIRFLPPPEGEEASFVKLYNHAFKSAKGQWYVENCLTTLGQDDPCCQHNQKLWATEIESNKKLASAQKRQLNYYTNVLVISDGQNPENNGTVRLFRFGPTIFEFIKSKITPEYADQTPVNVFDFWSGCNFRIRFRKDEHGYRKYDRSEWEQPSALFDGDDDKLEALWKTQHSLKDIIAPDKFKSFAELQARLNQVLGLDESAAANIPTAQQPTPKAQEPAALPTVENTPDVSDDEPDDNLDYFKNLGVGD